MSGLNKFLGRKEKHAKASQRENVMSPPVPCMLPTPTSSSNSSLHTLSAVSALVFPSHRHSSSSSSLSSLSLAFPHAKPKGSPRLQASGSLVESSTANTSDYYLLQPRQTSGHLHDVFIEQEERLPEKNEEEKIKALTRKLAIHGITHFQESDLEYVLNTTYTNGSQEKAFDLLVLLEESENGIVRECDPNGQLLGAVNLNGVTCYLDALLFALFARLSTFEAILYKTFEDGPKKQLITLLRLWVNILRTGRLITVDVTKQLQGALKACGWPEAAGRCQQDASEAFSFIMDTLEFPALTLKTDVFHGGKEDVDDDHRFVKERMLEVAIPEEFEDKQIHLEDCLEYHFNSRIEVRRALERRASVDNTKLRNSIDSAKGSSSHVHSVEIDGSQPSTPLTPVPQSPLPLYSPSRRSVSKPGVSSGVQDQYLSEKSEGPDIPPIPEDNKYKNRSRADSTAKTMTVPAWQFFRLLPWYTAEIGHEDKQVATHFSSVRPVLGICLKRYAMVSGQVVRRGTHVDIPLEIGLPNFIHPEEMSEDSTTPGEFKLVLQSVVCHRGEYVDSGHYVSLVRDPVAQVTNGSGLDGSWSQDRWMLFDDLADDRVSHIDIDEYLNKETPYLMFYQIHPIAGEPSKIDCTEKPPSYSSNGVNLKKSENSKDSKDSGVAGLSLNAADSRISTEEAPAISKRSMDGHASDDHRGRSSMMSDRRTSVAITDASTSNPRQDRLTETGVNGFLNGNGSLRISHEESRNGKKGFKSRHSSQTSEKRLSASFSRLTSKLTKEKNLITIEAVDPMEIPITLGPEATTLQQSETTKRTGSTTEHGKKPDESSQSANDKSKAKKPDRECIMM